MEGLTAGLGQKKRIISRKGTFYGFSHRKPARMKSKAFVGGMGMKPCQLLRVWVKKLFAPWFEHPKYVKNFSRRLQNLSDEITSRTTVHADIHYRSGLDSIIVVGRYRNHDYVRCFQVETKDFHEFVEIFRRIEPRGRVGRIDTPFPSCSGVVERIKRERGQR